MPAIGSTTTPNISFTLANNAVTGMSQSVGAKSYAVKLPTNATFSIAQPNAVIETIKGSTTTEVVKYVAPAGSTKYLVAQDTVTFAKPTTTLSSGLTNGYSFTIANGAVTAEQHVMGNSAHTTTHSYTLPPSTVASSSASGVTKTQVLGNAVVTTKFVQPTAGGLYAVASINSDFIDAGNSKTLLSVNPMDRMMFTVSGGKVMQAQQVNASGTASAVPTNSHVSFSVLAPSLVQETITFGNHSSYEVYYQGTAAKGVYTEVAHGSGATIDLVGLQAQLSHIPGNLLSFL